jgi:hypothetical protein
MERPRQDVSGYLDNVGKNIASVADSFKEDKSEAALGQFSADVADVENQIIEYKQQEADLMEQMMAASAAKADANVLSDISNRLSTLRAGRVQGTLSPMAARTYTNSLIKQYSMQYPALSQKIRSMANESMDNIREIHNELFQDDPIVKESRDVVAEAIRLGTSPDNIVAMRKAQAEAQAATAAYEIQEKTGKVTAKTTIQYVQSQVNTDALVDSQNLFLQITNAMAQDPNISADLIINQFTTVESNYHRKYAGFLIEKGAYSEANMKEAMAPATAIFSQVRQILSTQGGTVEEKVKAAKAQLELLNADRQSQALGMGSLLGGVFKYMPADAVWDAVQAAIQINSSLTDGSGFTMKDWSEAARAAAVTGQPALGMGMVILQSNQGKQMIGEMMGIKAFGNAAGANHPGMGDPVLDAASNRALNDMLGRMTNPDERQKVTGNALPYFDWIDLTNNPAVKAETQNNPAYRTHAVTQAASFASEWLIDMEKFGLKPTDVVINHGDMQHPITIKGEKVGNLNWNTYFQGRKPDYRELEALPVSERLNFMYRDILNTYGAAGVNEWLDALGFKAEGKYRKPELGSESKKKVTNSFSDAYSSAEKKYGLPEGLLASIGGVESSHNPDAIGKLLPDGTRAMGIMQIIPKWHPGVNAMNPDASIDYAGSYLRRLYDQFGSWDKAVAAYNWGEGPERMGKVHTDPNWKEKLPKETKDYLRKIFG